MEDDKVLLLVLAGLLGFVGGILVMIVLKRTGVYTNIEEWEILRDERGRTIGVRAKRTAEEA